MQLMMSNLKYNKIWVCNTDSSNENTMILICEKCLRVTTSFLCSALSWKQLFISMESFLISTNLLVHKLLNIDSNFEKETSRY